MLPYPSIFGSLATLKHDKRQKSRNVAIPFYFRVTCNFLYHPYPVWLGSCHTLLFSGHLQHHTHWRYCPGQEVAIPFYFRVTCNHGSSSANCSSIRCHTLLFSGHLQLWDQRNNRWSFFVAIPFYFRVTCNKIPEGLFDYPARLPYPSIFGSLATHSGVLFSPSCHCCHTLLFSGHLQLIFPPGISFLSRLPYPSIFGSLATNSNRDHILHIMVAIPFYFRVTCNTTGDFIHIQFASCHTLLFSGHLQQFKTKKSLKEWVVAIPFYFRVTCNNH